MRAATSVGATVEVTQAPTITNGPVSQSVMVSNNAVFTVGVSGDLPLSYQWYFNATNAVGLNTNALTLTNVQGSQAGNYTVVVDRKSVVEGKRVDLGGGRSRKTRPDRWDAPEP